MASGARATDITPVRVQRVRTSPNPMARLQPRDGDIVVTRESHSAVTYTVRQVPGGAQFRSPIRREAVRMARGFAQTNAVDLWYNREGTCRLLEAYRRQGG